MQRFINFQQLLFMNEMEEETKKKRMRIPGKRTVIAVTSPQQEIIIINEPEIIKISEIAAELEVELYLVGGYVRDYYLDKPRNDFDFTVVGDSIEFAEAVAARFKSKAITYPRFKTAMVPIGNSKYEFVGTRKEVYSPESRNPVISNGTLEDDLKRRDFTINAMAISLNKNDFGTVIDIFEAKKDLDNRILRTPLDPVVTFSEDPLRMLRAARFSAQLGFRVDWHGVSAIRQMTDRIRIISQERITDEILKILATAKPSIGFHILNETGLLEIIFPELQRCAGTEAVKDNGREYTHKDILLHSLRVCDNVALKSDNVWLRLAALVHDIAKPLTKKYTNGVGWSFHGHEELGARFIHTLFRRFKLPFEHEEYVEKIVRLHQRPMALVFEKTTDSAIRRLAFQSGDALEDLLLLCRCDITTNNPNISERYLKNYDVVAQKIIDVQNRDKLREFQSPVRGEEIMELCSLPPSPAVGWIKTTIEEAILDGIIPNDYETAKNYLIKHKVEWLKVALEENLRKKRTEDFELK